MGLKNPISPLDTTIQNWKKDHPFKYEKGEHITSQEAVDVLYQESKGDAIITTGVGHIVGSPVLAFKEPKILVSHLALGTMGFGYPAAVGAKVTDLIKRLSISTETDHF